MIVFEKWPYPKVMKLFLVEPPDEVPLELLFLVSCVEKFNPRLNAFVPFVWAFDVNAMAHNAPMINSLVFICVFCV